MSFQYYNMINKKNSIILVALKQELPKNYLPDWHIIYSGVGKINAAITISKAYYEFNPKHFINYGTAGAISENMTGLIEISKFFQRDMDVRGLGFELGETPFEKINHIKFKKDGYSCGTGDSFLMNKPELLTDVVDMEAFSYAKFCYLKNLNFICHKYISDNANNKAANDWSKSFKIGAKMFRDLLLKNYG